MVPVLEARGLSKSYGDIAALRGVDLSVAPGEVLGLVGANGAGKTTLLSIAAGLRRPDAGRVLIEGLDVAADPTVVHARLGLVPQDLGIYPSVRVRDNLELFGRLAGLRGPALHRRMAEVAEALDLTRVLQRRGRALSGGEKRRVHIALALLHRPALLLLDEPTTALDVDARSALLALVREWSAEGAAVCWSTNQLSEVETLAGSAAILDGGSVLASGPVADLVAAHGRETVEVVRPSLETVFLTLTGRRYRPGGGVEAEGAHGTPS